MDFNQVREELVAALGLSYVGKKAADPTAKTFSMGRISGLEEALRILDRAIQGEARSKPGKKKI